MMLSKSQRTMKSAGAWCIVLGVVSIVTGVAVGVGSIVAGGKLLSHSSSD